MGKEKGFTFTELLLTTAVLGILVLGIFGVFSTALDQEQSLRNRSIALNLARSEMEKILADRRVYGFSYIIPKNYPEKEIEGFSRRVTIKQISHDFKIITVTLSWSRGEESLTTGLGNY